MSHRTIRNIVGLESRPYRCTVCHNLTHVDTNHEGPIWEFCKKCSWKGHGFDSEHTTDFNGRAYRLHTFVPTIEARHASIELFTPRHRREEPHHPFEASCLFQGIPIDIENRIGGTRSGVDPNGKRWAVTMMAHYGEIRGVEGADGDKLDCYVGDNDNSKWVYVIHQRHPSDHPETPWEYDEDKVILGVDAPDDALRLYMLHYDDAADVFGGMSMMHIDRFKAWLKNPEAQGEPVQPPIKWKPR